VNKQGNLEEIMELPEVTPPFLPPKDDD